MTTQLSLPPAFPLSSFRLRRVAGREEASESAGFERAATTRRGDDQHPCGALHWKGMVAPRSRQDLPVSVDASARRADLILIETHTSVDEETDLAVRV